MSSDEPKNDETKPTPGAEGEAVQANPLHEKAALGMGLPAILVGIMGVITLWGMFGKEDGYDWGGFDGPTFLRGMGMLVTAGLLVLAYWGLSKGRRWAAGLGLALCALGLLIGLRGGYEWATGAAEASGMDGASMPKILVLIGLLILGSIVEAVLLVRLFLEPAWRAAKVSVPEMSARTDRPGRSPGPHLRARPRFGTIWGPP